MTSRNWIGLVVIWATLVAGGLPAANAQQDDAPGGYAAILDNMDLLVDNYVRFVGRKYDLTDEQYEQTLQMVRTRADSFLSQNEDQVRELVDELFAVRTGEMAMSPDELIAWGQRATPIYESAKRMIETGNDDWRQILTPEQRAIHDEDLELMRESFATTEDQLDRIVSGDMTVDEFRNPRKMGRARGSRNAQQNFRDKMQARNNREQASANPDFDEDRRRAQQENRQRGLEKARAAAAGGNARPTPPGARADGKDRAAVTRGSDGRRSVGRRGESAGKGGKDESEWEAYVRQFIEKYKLNDEQQQKALAILADCQKTAERYRLGKQSTLDQIEAQEAQLREKVKSGDNKDAKNRAVVNKELGELSKKKDDLLEPISRIFDKQLKPRLERLPTRAQRRDANAADAAQKVRGRSRTRAGKDKDK